MVPNNAYRIGCGLAAAATTFVTFAQTTADMNASNNPLAPTIGASLQDQYVGSVYGPTDNDSNAALLRGTLPHKLFGQPQIFRATLPVVTTAPLAPSGERYNGLGDLNVFDVFLFKAAGIELGLGPQLTIPTASHDQTGTGKWQGGLAAIVIAPQKWGLLGGLVTWQQSFAGDGDRASTNGLVAQPFVIYNLPDAWYLRSTASWNFDLTNGRYTIPIGLGVGRIWKVGKETLNLSAEPQWTVAHDGRGQPKFQLFFGLTVQFPL